MNFAPLPPQPGRVCPLDYRYEPGVFGRAAEIEAAALYVAGGLYGNLQALEAAEAMAGAEPGARLVLNGDFHWFDAEPGWFAAVGHAAEKHLRIRGNVESEIARGPSEAGCGCAYPDSVDDGTVARSNAIMARLSAVAEEGAGAAGVLGRLPMHLVAQVGEAKVAVVHGDAESLAGWRFDREALDDPRQRPWPERVSRESGIDIFASTHTCAPALRRFRFAGREMVVVNNGAAGMPNAAGKRFGIVTRIGVAPSPVEPLYGLIVRGVHVDALPVAYDHPAFLAAFDACWASGSPAAISYRERIVSGPAGGLGPAMPREA
jgi:hypothetical protein